MINRARILLATVGVPAVAIAAAATLGSMWSSRLPAVVAIRWTNGTPNNSAAVDPFLKFTLLVSAGLAMVVSTMAVTALRRGNGLARTAIGCLVGVATLPAGGTIGVLIANLDVRDWHEATGSALVVAVTPFVAVIGGALASCIAGATPAAQPLSGPADDAPAIGLGPSQRAVWIGSTTNRFLLSSVLVNQVGMVPVSAWIYAVLFGVGLVVTLIGSRLGATVDSTGVTIRIGLLGWPRRHLPLDRIDHARAVKLGLFQGGGFGYRVNPFTGMSLYKLRSGPALAITMRKGGLVYVTVDSPEPGAGLLNDLLRRQALTGPRPEA
ncbi:hypothetical protein [Amycolatopsis anabasis]|uniref:hypothetical protein n=1 Tax=Amycolatopsis anabasis TaxID=1840409 RepID=UPI00131C7B09|nr:hypothetical protein [Amycolatopsis anabasis]